MNPVFKAVDTLITWWCHAVLYVTLSVVFLILSINVGLRYRQMFLQMQQSESRLRAIADTAVDGMVMIDAQGRVQSFNAAAERILGWRPEELIGRSAPDVIHPDDMAEIGAMVVALNEHAARVRARRVRMLRKDGTWQTLQFRGRPALDDAGAVVGHIITFQDTTERDEALRAMSVLSEGNRVLARVDSEDELLQAMCEAIVETGEYPLAWYGQRVNDDQRSVAKVAVAGPSSDYVDAIEISWGDGPLGAGPTGTALRTDATQVRADYESDAAFRPWLAAAQEAGLRSSISLPVRVDGQIDGVLVVAAAEPHAFDQRATGLLETLASDLGLGLHRLRSLQALEESSRQLEEQNDRLRGVFDSQFDPFVLLETVHDESGTPVDLRYIAMSDATLEYNRLSREEMIGHTISELFPGQVADGSLAAYLSVVATGTPIVMDDFEYFHEPREETVRLDIRAVKSGDGVAITFRDVTRRHEAAAALAAASEKLKGPNAQKETQEGLLKTKEGELTAAKEALAALEKKIADSYEGGEAGVRAAAAEARAWRLQERAGVQRAAPPRGSSAYRRLSAGVQREGGCCAGVQRRDFFNMASLLQRASTSSLASGSSTLSSSQTVATSKHTHR